MGGINHAPCNRYLVISTSISQSLTLGHAYLNMANVELERLLLSELSGTVGELDPILEKLDESKCALELASDHLETLRREMIVEGYRDLSPLHHGDLDEVGEILAGKRMINLESWDRMLDLIRGSTFFGAIAHFCSGLEELQDLTEALRDKCQSLTADVEARTVNIVLEQNYPSSIKPEFAALFTSWSMFMADFLASSLISTEVWYRHSDYGSILDHLPKPADEKVIAL
jgi:hypothetical protein